MPGDTREASHRTPMSERDSLREESMRTGKVARWVASRGFGFIVGDNGGPDVFCHLSALPHGLDRLVVGTRVNFDIVKDREGRRVRQTSSWSTAPRARAARFDSARRHDRDPPTARRARGGLIARVRVRIFPSCGGASARYKSYNGPIDLRVKQREFISLVGGAAVNWLLAAERSKPSRCDRLCITRGISTAAGNDRGRHYLTTRPCLDRRAVGSHGHPGAILVFVGRGWGQQRRSSACAITAYTMLSHGLPRLVTN